MNGNDILRAMNGLDEKYIISANGEQTLKQGRKPAKSIFKTSVAIAAAAALMIPVGAYAYTRLIHRESVEMYLENSAKVEESGNAVNRVMENEHIRITLDTVLSDGYMAMAIVTLDALDEYGRNFVLTHPDIMSMLSPYQYRLTKISHLSRGRLSRNSFISAEINSSLGEVSRLASGIHSSISRVSSTSCAVRFAAC